MAGIPIWRGLVPVLLLCFPLPAFAHIKWFAEVDVSGDPRMPWMVFATPSFAALGLIAIAAMFASGWLDARIARAPRGLVARVRAFDAGASASTIMRLGIAACFIADVVHFKDMAVFLTPELKGDSAWIRIAQWTVALAALFERPIVAAAGIALLFVEAAAHYGLFHLMDYPLFIGIAVFLAAGERWRPQAAMLLRACVALTFMWGGIEKWLYPQWTFPLLCGSGKALTMGLDPDFFMQAAGFVEFALAFVVLAGELAARVASLALVGVFAAAIPMFGVVDAVGHAPFMLALIVLAVRPNEWVARFACPRALAQGASWALAFVVALGGMPLAYYAAHQLAYARPWSRLEPASVAGGVACLLVAVVFTALRARGRLAGRGRMSLGPPFSS